MKKLWLRERPLIIAVGVGIGLWVGTQIIARAVWVLAIIVVALVLAAGMAPVVALMRRLRLPPHGWRIPKALAVLIIYLVVIAIVGLVLFLIGEAILGEMDQIRRVLPQIAQQAIQRIEAYEQIIPGLTGSIGGVAGGVGNILESAVKHFATFVFRLFITLMMALFMVVESERLLAFWAQLFPPSKREDALRMTRDVGHKVGRWVLGQLAIACITGTMGGLIAIGLGLPYPALFGALTFLLDLTPIVGPSIMAAPAFFVGLSHSPLMAGLGVIAYVGISEIEGHVLQPLIVGRAVRFSLTLVVIAFPFGLALYGPIGALISIPVTAALQVFTNDVFLPWLHKRQEIHEQETDQLEE